MNGFLGKLLNLIGIVYEDGTNEGSYMDENPREYTRGTGQQVPPRRQAQLNRQNTYIPEYSGSTARRTAEQVGRGHADSGSFRGSRYDADPYSGRTNASGMQRSNPDRTSYERRGFEQRSYDDIDPEETGFDRTGEVDYDPFDPRKTGRSSDRSGGSRFGKSSEGFGAAEEPRETSRFGGEADYERRNTSAKPGESVDGRFGKKRPAAPRYNYEERSPESAPRRDSLRAERSYENRTVMLSLNTLEDCCDIIEQLVLHNTVVLSMDTGDAAMERRVLDTLAGAAFALGGNIRRASSNTYLLVPEAQNGYGL